MNQAVKGFRPKKAPSKGQVNKANNDLNSELRQSLKGMSQMLMQNMQEVNFLRQELTAMIDILRFSEKPMAEAAEGDTVMLDFLGRLVNEDGSIGDMFTGGKGLGYTIEIGSGRLVEGFEEQLKGLKKGEIKQVEVTFPEDYQAASLKSKKAIFDVEIIHVYKKDFKNHIAELEKKFNDEKKEKRKLEENSAIVKESKVKPEIKDEPKTDKK